MVVFLYVALVSNKNGDIFAGKKPTIKFFYESNLTMFSVLFEDAVKMKLRVIVIEIVNFLEDSSPVFEMLGGEFLFVVSGEILRLKIVELFHSSSTEKEVILLFICIIVGLSELIVLSVFIEGVDLTESVAPSYVDIIGIAFAVGFVFHWTFVVKGDVLEVDIVPNRVLFVHDFNFLGFLAVFQILMWVSNP